MLSELLIENLGVIERLELVLGPGFTALTGETGAGKTMLVEAIDLLVGGRADSTAVRHGAEEARVDGRFIDRHGNETVLSRAIPAEGRSRAYIDGRLATVASLSAAASGLVDIHGQHAHQHLLSSAAQRDALDRFGAIDLDELRAARARLTEIDAELAAFGGDAHARAREIDLLRYQVDELDAAAIDDPDEDRRLDEEESVLADAEAHRDAGRIALGALADDDGARDRIGAAIHALRDRVPFTGTVERLVALAAEIDDLSSEVRAVVDGVEESPERLAEVRERRHRLVELRRKYGDELAEVMAFHTEAARRLRDLEGYDARAADLDEQRRAATEAERVAARRVGTARRAAAPRLAELTQARLRELAMPSAAIAVEVGAHADDHPGDRVQFLLAANPGAPLLPLTRVASGGELARAMLALRLTLLDAHDVADEGGTLVFDEVDAGVGGRAAEAVAAALAALGRRNQVLVVTHLAQVAARADAQIHVSKSVTDGRTYATARSLDPDDRIDEIARMLSGSASDTARDHARELLG